MQATHPLSLLLVALLAFWMPVSQCCAAQADAAPATPAQSEPVPPCHPQPTEAPAPCDVDPDCNDTCDCTPLMRSVCQNDRSPAATTNSGQSQFPVSSMSAALLPASMQPHTFIHPPARPAADAGPPPTACPSLIALNCQLTL